MSTTKVNALFQSGDSEKNNVSQKLLMISVDQLVNLLVQEMDAKNQAYYFIIKKGLLAEFNDFKKVLN